MQKKKRGPQIMSVTTGVAWVPGPSLMLLEGCEVRDGGEIAFSSATERLRGLDMIM